MVLGDVDKNSQMMNSHQKCQRVTIPNSNLSLYGPPILTERTTTNLQVLDQIHLQELLVSPKQLIKQKQFLVFMETLILVKKLTKVTSEDPKELI